MYIIFLLFLTFLNIIKSAFPTYEQYLIKFKKTYTQAEKDKRAVIYNKKIQFFNQNPKEAANYTVNRFTDWLDSQLAAFTNTKFDQKAPSAQFQSSLQLGPKLAAPLSIDWRTQGIISSIKDQKTCGDCWAFTAVAMAESVLLNNTKKQYDLSEQFVLECTSSGACNGGYINDALQTIVNKKGLPIQTTYPYQATKPSYGTGICNPTNIVNVPVTGQIYYYKITAENIRQLLSQSPVAIAMKVQTKFYSYMSGVYSCQSTNFSQLNHAVQLIGYDSKGNWLIKNQWGTSWGMDGYAYLDAQNSCGVGLAVYTFTQFQAHIILYVITLMIFMLQ